MKKGKSVRGQNTFNVNLANQKPIQYYTVYIRLLCTVHIRTGYKRRMSFTRKSSKCTVCPKISAPFFIVNYCIKWATTSWTYSM